MRAIFKRILTFLIDLIEHALILICISYIVVTQPYNPEILTEYVIRGNSAILKCSIPSYIAEFVTVEAWIREDGEVYLPEDPAVVQGTTDPIGRSSIILSIPPKICIWIRMFILTKNIPKINNSRI